MLLAGLRLTGGVCEETFKKLSAENLSIQNCQPKCASTTRTRETPLRNMKTVECDSENHTQSAQTMSSLEWSALAAVLTALSLLYWVKFSKSARAAVMQQSLKRRKNACH